MQRGVSGKNSEEATVRFRVTLPQVHPQADPETWTWVQVVYLGGRSSPKLERARQGGRGRVQHMVSCRPSLESQGLRLAGVPEGALWSDLRTA